MDRVALEPHPHDDLTDPDVARWPVRLWPALLILLVVPVFMIGPAWLLPRTMVHFVGFFAAPMLGTIASVIWWTFGARVHGRERWLFPVLILLPAVVLAATIFRDFPFAIPVYALPLVIAVWVIAFALTPSVPRGSRRTIATGAIVAAWGVIALVRTEGADADTLIPALRWFWQPTAEARFQAEQAAGWGTAAPQAATVVVAQGDWPAFRGPTRDSVVHGVKIATDWEAHPPELVWRHLVGPGWGSFAVVGNRLFTQEQRGDDETVVCYAADSGAEIWEYRHTARFFEAMGGAGPRATPTVYDGRVYAQGATGKLVCLDAVTGQRAWEADVTAEPHGVVPQWGYSSSPLVADGVVVVYAGGAEGKGTAAYRADTGAFAWAGGQAKHSYSSAHLATLLGVRQILMVSDYGVESFRPADGKLLWENVWNVKGMNRVTQPTVIGDSDVVFGNGVGSEQGARRFRVTRSGDEWKTQTVWTSKDIKPYFNDGVVVKDHMYGFSDSWFCCIDLATGKEKWKERGYGHGQVLALADQGLLLVQAVDGRVVLLEANPAEQVELGTYPALNKKTWNHPVIAHGYLFVRNNEEAACYRLKTQ